MSRARLVHHVPGRLRLCVDAAKRDSARLLAIQEGVRVLAGVRQVSFNPTLGTLVIAYDPALSPIFAQSLAGYASANALFELPATTADDDEEEAVSAADRSLDKLASNVNRGVQSLTANTVNLKELFPFSLVLYAVFFVDKAVNAAQWLNWLQFAFSSYMELHQSQPVTNVGRSVDALRAEINAMHADLRRLASRMDG